MNTTLTLSDGESQAGLRQALRTLRAIRLRYEIDRLNSDGRLPRMLVSLSCTDMMWINATIEALEESIAAGSSLRARADMAPGRAGRDSST